MVWRHDCNSVWEQKMSWSELFFQKGVKDEDLQKVHEVRTAFANCAMILESNLPEGRYKAIVKTEMEKVAAIATKSFTHNEVK